MKSPHRFLPNYALILLIVTNLLIGGIFGDQYGQTWDEPSFYLYGERSYEAYEYAIIGKPIIPERHIFFLDLRYYGAFYAAIAWKVVEIFRRILPAWGYVDIWHFVNFAFFQFSLISLYFLAKRYLSSWMSLIVVLFFGTQPLVFGHAFINPKDIPFMTFFLLSVTIGLYMVDAIKKYDADEKGGVLSLRAQLFLSVLFGLLVLSYVGKDVIYSFVAYIISLIYNAPADSFLGTVFSLITRSSIRLPLENYIHKASSARLERVFIYILFLAFIGRKIYFERLRGLMFLFNINFRLFFLVVFSGIVLGFATSIRLLAPFAGLLVVGYALGTRGRSSIPALVYYFAIAAVVTCLTWPFLWNSPVYNFLEALKVMRDFPFNAEIRFLGDNISPSNLPWFYIPLLVSIQITIPVILLAWFGFFTINLNSSRKNIIASVILLAWFVLPVGLQMMLKSNVYDNFRQFLFILPPMFVLAGMGFSVLFSRIVNHAVKITVLALCLLPGLIGLVSLHPVQYIYYNRFVGGVSGAEGDFELDYWLVSYRETTSYINENASPHANLLAWGSGFNGAREDLNIYSFSSMDELEKTSERFEYVVISTRFFSHLDIFPDAPIVFEVRRNGALLSVVKKLDQ